MQFKRQVLQVLMAEIPVLVTGLVLTRSENRPPMFLGRKREGRPCKGDPVLEDIGGSILGQMTRGPFKQIRSRCC